MKKTTPNHSLSLFGKLLILVFLTAIPLQMASQEEGDRLEKIKDFFTIYPNKKKAAADSTLYPSKLILAPVATFSPETNLGLGVGAKYLFKFKGSGDETRTSNMPISLQYTLKNQFFFFSGFEIFTNQEKWVLTGNIRFQNFPRLYYGIGRNTPEENEEQYDNYQATFEPILLKRLFTKYLFLGGGVRYNRIFNVGIEENGLLATNRPSGFNGSTSVGVELAALYDSRDNILNASKGWFLEFTHGTYGKALGGTHKFSLTRFDIRYFTRVSKKNKDVLGFQFMGHFSNDDVPFSELALLGSSEILRGYREGRFVDRNLLASQVEYRKTFKDSRWGAVAYAGIGDVFNNTEQLKISSLKPNFGIGLRFLLDKEENLNIRADWGVGKNTNNFYVNIAEAF